MSNEIDRSSAVPARRKLIITLNVPLIVMILVGIGCDLLLRCFSPTMGC